MAEKEHSEDFDLLSFEEDPSPVLGAQHSTLDQEGLSSVEEIADRDSTEIQSKRERTLTEKGLSHAISINQANFTSLRTHLDKLLSTVSTELCKDEKDIEVLQSLKERISARLEELSVCANKLKTLTQDDTYIDCFTDLRNASHELISKIVTVITPAGSTVRHEQVSRHTKSRASSRSSGLSRASGKSDKVYARVAIAALQIKAKGQSQINQLQNEKEQREEEEAEAKAKQEAKEAEAKAKQEAEAKTNKANQEAQMKAKDAKAKRDYLQRIEAIKLQTELEEKLAELEILEEADNPYPLPKLTPVDLIGYQTGLVKQEIGLGYDRVPATIPISQPTRMQSQVAATTGDYHVTQRGYIKLDQHAVPSSSSIVTRTPVTTSVVTSVTTTLPSSMYGSLTNIDAHTLQGLPQLPLFTTAQATTRDTTHPISTMGVPLFGASLTSSHAARASTVSHPAHSVTSAYPPHSVTSAYPPSLPVSDPHHAWDAGAPRETGRFDIYGLSTPPRHIDFSPSVSTPHTEVLDPRLRPQFSSFLPTVPHQQ
ncbi:hypothetical protein V1264_003331 [Littorina saxatilis]|uniref:Uncharacterized protein n=1 Tax=Littorina saxatilis TaxID=31220 RepID=A0AAN9B8F4_9CAEN